MCVPGRKSHERNTSTENEDKPGKTRPAENGPTNLARPFVSPSTVPAEGASAQTASRSQNDDALPTSRAGRTKRSFFYLDRAEATDASSSSETSLRRNAALLNFHGGWLASRNCEPTSLLGTYLMVSCDTRKAVLLLVVQWRTASNPVEFSTLLFRTKASFLCG